MLKLDCGGYYYCIRFAIGASVFSAKTLFREENIQLIHLRLFQSFTLLTLYAHFDANAAPVGLILFRVSFSVP